MLIDNHECLIVFVDHVYSPLNMLKHCHMHFCDRLIGKMKRIAFRQFQLLWEISMLCIHQCCPIHLVRACCFTRRENYSIAVLRRIPVMVLVWTSHFMFFGPHPLMHSSVKKNKNMPNRGLWITVVLKLLLLRFKWFHIAVACKLYVPHHDTLPLL